MGFQFTGGVTPRGVTTSRLLVIGPDEFYESDYHFVAGILDEATARLDNVEIVALGDGTNFAWRGKVKVRCGIDMLAIRWAGHHRYTRKQLPIRLYKSVKERDEDLIAALGTGPHCVYFYDPDDDESNAVYHRLLRRVLTPKRTTIVRV